MNEEMEKAMLNLKRMGIIGRRLWLYNMGVVSPDPRRQDIYSQSEVEMHIRQCQTIADDNSYSEEEVYVYGMPGVENMRDAAKFCLAEWNAIFEHRHFC